MKIQSATIASPTIDPAEIERFSRMASEWWDLNGKFKPLHRINPLRIGYIRDRACEHYNRDAQTPAPLSGLTLLDIGCGGGLLCEPMTRLGANVTGIDAAEKTIKTASLHAAQGNLTIDYRATSAEALAAENIRYDVVLALEIIEHVADIPAFVATCCSLVKPGGLIIWSTLNRTPKSYALAIVGAEYLLRWLPVGTHTWSKFVKPAELVKQLRQNAIEVIHMTGMTMSPLDFKWKLTPNALDVNYLVTGKKQS